MLVSDRFDCFPNQYHGKMAGKHLPYIGDFEITKGFLKMVGFPTIGFPTKNQRLGCECFGGTTILSEHPYRHNGINVEFFRSITFQFVDFMGLHGWGVLEPC